VLTLTRPIAFVYSYLKSNFKTLPSKFQKRIIWTNTKMDIIFNTDLHFHLKFNVKISMEMFGDTCGKFCKRVMIVIYDCSDSGLYYKRLVNYASSSVALAGMVTVCTPKAIFLIVVSLYDRHLQ